MMLYVRKKIGAWARVWTRKICFIRRNLTRRLFSLCIQHSGESTCNLWIVTTSPSGGNCVCILLKRFTFPFAFKLVSSFKLHTWRANKNAWAHISKLSLSFRWIQCSIDFWNIGTVLQFKGMDQDLTKKLEA